MASYQILRFVPATWLIRTLALAPILASIAHGPGAIAIGHREGTDVPDR
jgi:hypothetical protein